MKLITQNLIKRFNEVGDQSDANNPLIIAKFFDPVGSATWYATQYDLQRNNCFGYVTGLFNDEWGAFSIDELESLKRPFGLSIERDIHFSEIHFNELMKKPRLLELEKSQASKEKTEELAR